MATIAGQYKALRNRARALPVRDSLGNPSTEEPLERSTGVKRA